jgi:hypothetical protein
MRKLAIVLAASALPALASAQGSVSAAVQLRLDLPVVLPALVVVTPGVQVVPDVDEEVFFVDGWYWVRQPSGWYRSRSHRHGWVVVPAGRVPARLVSIPSGKYKRYKPAKHHPHDDGHHGHDHGGHGHGNDHGKGHGKGKH